MRLVTWNIHGGRGRDGRCDPARVAVTPVASTVERITQRIIQVDFSAKSGVLAQLLKQEPVDRALIFTRTKHGADKVVKGLVRAGIPADAIRSAACSTSQADGAPARIGSARTIARVVRRKISFSSRVALASWLTGRNASSSSKYA